MVRIISIEGNIGSGKSTLVQLLKNYNIKNVENIYFLQEPVDEWNNIQDNDGKNIIEKYYSDQYKYSFSFQMMAYISRLSSLKKAINNKYDIIITERSLLTDKNVFAQMLYDSGKMEHINYVIYNKWFDEFISDIPKVEYIYIKTTPEIAYERIMKRNRLGENISKEYLCECSNYHDKWLNDEYTIDGNLDINNVFAKLIEYTNKMIISC